MAARKPRKKEKGYPPKVKKGALHKELGMKPGKKIGRARLEAIKAKAKRTGNVKEERRAVFALNFNKGRGKKKK